MVVFIRIVVEIVTSEHRPQIFHPCRISIGQGADPALSPGMADLHPLFDFQNYATQTIHATMQDDFVVLGVVEYLSIRTFVVNEPVLL